MHTERKIRSTTSKKRVNSKRKISKKRRKRIIRRRLKFILRLFILLSILTLITVSIVLVVKKLIGPKVVEQSPAIEEQFLTKNPYSRSGEALKKVKGIVIHYTANPGTTAKNNRDYFESLKDTKLTKVSSHYVIGIEGEIIQCIPLNEISYASNDRNYDTISIECCHLEEDGKFSKETYNALIHLVAWLCGQYSLDGDDVIRHYDITEKICPKYFVDHEDSWIQFKEDLTSYIDAYGK